MTSPRQQQIRRVLWGVLAVNLVVAGVKIAYGLFAHSIAIQADAMHSTFDGLANLVGLAAMAVAAAPPDQEHPYGHHRFELLGAVGIAAMIGGTAVGIAWEALSRVGQPTGAHIEPAGLVLLVVLAFVSLGISRYEARVGRELGSPVLAADSKHTLTDFFGTLVVFAAAVGIWLGIGWMDTAAALVVAGLVGLAAWQIVRSALDVFLEAAAVDVSAVERATLSVDGVVSCHKIRSRGSEDAIFVDLHIQVDPEEPVRVAHDRSGAVKAAILTAIPGVIDVLVHIEPIEEHDAVDR